MLSVRNLNLKDAAYVIYVVFSQLLALVVVY